jgi:exonuclease SbcD
MRFLHTSDWHLGKTLKGRSRSEEHESALAEILDIARHEKIDCLLITGDIFDSHAPPPDSERLAFDFFSELRRAGISAIIICGNHDHPRRLAAIRDILRLLDIHVRAEPARPDAGGIVEVGKTGERARVAVLPFVTIGRIEDAARLMGPEVERYQDYAERIAEMIDILCASFSAETINLLLAHLYVDGAQTSRSEREIHVAKPYAVSAQRFPSNAQYIALGHLHRPQEIAAPSRTFYAGSLLQLDFGEQDQQKRIILIDAHPKMPPAIESIPLASGRHLRDIKGTLDQIRRQASAVGNDLLRVTVVIDKPAPGIADLVHEILPNTLEVKLDYPRVEASAPVIAGTDPLELFRLFFAHHRGSEPPEPLARLFRDLYEEALNAPN